MASGDPQITTGSVGGGSSTTISVPSGESWIFHVAGIRPDLINVGADNGTSSRHDLYWDGTRLDTATATMKMTTRPVYDASLEPQIKNTYCSTLGYYFAAREM